MRKALLFVFFAGTGFGVFLARIDVTGSVARARTTAETSCEQRVRLAIDTYTGLPRPFKNLRRGTRYGIVQVLANQHALIQREAPLSEIILGGNGPYLVSDLPNDLAKVGAIFVLHPPSYGGGTIWSVE